MAKTKSITLKGDLARIFVEGHNPKRTDTEDQHLERIALAIHMDMGIGRVDRAVATLKALKAAAQSGVLNKHEPSKPSSGSRTRSPIVDTHQASERSTKGI